MQIESKQYYLALSDETRKYVNLYKTNVGYEGVAFFSEHINSLLRDTPPQGGPWMQAMGALDAAISGNTSTEEMTLYSATANSLVKPLINDDLLRYPAYVSTSIKKGTPAKTLRAHDSDHALLIITSPAKTPMLAMEDMSEEGDDEAEFLLGRGTIFKINSVKCLIRPAISEVLSPCSVPSVEELTVYYLSIHTKID